MPKRKSALLRGAMDIFFPEDKLEVEAFTREYGEDLKQALRKPKSAKHYKFL